ncbi:hypothetical protein EDC04DRAFT_2614334 [Pisolithus marmoratus]|nr:hypothetical protein EDC04DRAFT_2614334 [Pisolithus marmoratus]
MPPKVCVPKASWNDQEVGSLICYLHEHRAEVGDNGNFKSSTYKSAAEHISKHLTSGLAKTTAMVRNKWVSHGKFDEVIFEDYAKTHPSICPFKHSGWEYYELMLNMMPNGVACSTNAFSPSASHAVAPGAVDHIAENLSVPNVTKLARPLTLGSAVSDRSMYPLSISQWHKMLPSDNFPSPPLTGTSGVQTDTPLPSSTGMSDAQSSEVPAAPPSIVLSTRK